MLETFQTIFTQLTLHAAGPWDALVDSYRAGQAASACLSFLVLCVVAMLVPHQLKFNRKVRDGDYCTLGELYSTGGTAIMVVASTISFINLCTSVCSLASADWQVFHTIIN